MKMANLFTVVYCRILGIYIFSRSFIYIKVIVTSEWLIYYNKLLMRKLLRKKLYFPFRGMVRGVIRMRSSYHNSDELKKITFMETLQVSPNV